MSEKTPKYNFTRNEIADANQAQELFDSYQSSNQDELKRMIKAENDPRNAYWDFNAKAGQHAEATIGHPIDAKNMHNVAAMYREAYTDNEQFDKVADAKQALSTELHEDWRNGIRAGFEADGKSPDTPRLRASKDKTGEKDEAWYQEQEAAGVVFTRDENGARLVNTNVPYNELSPSWKDANIGAATFVVEGIAADLSGGENVSDEYVESFSSKIHDKWMQDNSWQKDSTPELFVPYDELPEPEKAKDRNQVLLALAKLTEK